ncbi:MAG: hypothetical protein CME65_10530 [Halobacteriovoraceae bacterium]|nr:hypothetical protein [Halobacteriovoraceae bacterium]
MNRRFMFKSLALLFFTVFVSTDIFAKNDVNNFIEVTEKNKVCMVNNFYNPMADFTEFKVNVEKKSYYGCCAMCKDKLKMSSNHRMATDPLTNEKISKADAYIVADKTNKGRTYYFKSKSNFLKWTKL